jgi:hypothetical protein
VSIQGVSIPDLQKNYPRGEKTPTDIITDFLGADHWLLKTADPNTCAIRLSRAFNYAGAPIKKTAGLLTEKGTDGKWYLIRANDFARYCENQFGKADVTQRGKSEANLKDAIRGQPGVVLFRLKKQTRSGRELEMSAFGHGDIWDGSVVWYNDVFWETWQVVLWRVGAP